MMKKVLFALLLAFIAIQCSLAEGFEFSAFFQRKKVENTIRMDTRSLFTSSGEIEFQEVMDPVYGLSLDMEIERLSDNYLVRVVMEDSNGMKYLVVEDYPMLGMEGKTVYEDFCEETALLWEVRPKKLRIHCHGAKVTINSLRLTSSLEKGIISSDIVNELSCNLRLHQAEEKRDALEKTVRARGKLWFAGITSLSLLPFAERMRVMGLPEDGYTNGIEFYDGGIFDIASLDNETESDIQEQMMQSGIEEPPCVEAFSWRDRHGKDWLTPVKDQGESGYCSAFTAISCLEAVVNLYFNKKIDMDLSEQEAAVCNGSSNPWHGMSLSTPLHYIRYHGVCEETAYPFVNDPVPCESGNISPTENVRINNYQYVSLNEQSIKKALIKYGPLASGFTRYDHTIPPDSMPPNHAMALYGYGVVHAGDTIFHLWNYNAGDHGLVPAFIVEENSPFIDRTVWKFKNSYINGDNTNPPYMFIVYDNLGHMPGCYALISPVTSLIFDAEDIVWEDVDGDGFYNWGISENKPSSCPSWVPEEKDGDDSNPTIGPMDEYGYTTDANPEDNPIIYITTNTSSSSPASYSNNVIVQNNATWILSHEHHFHYGAWIKVKTGSKLVINACTLASAKLILEPGSKLVISNGGKLVTPANAKFTAPLGATVDISSGTIM